MKKLLKNINKLYILFKKHIEKYIVKKGNEAETFNNRNLVKHFLLKGYTVEEIAAQTPMTLNEVSSHARYWMGEIPHKRQIVRR